MALIKQFSLPSQEVKSFSNLTDVPSHTEWKGYQKLLFRIAFVFFIGMSIPTETWYNNFFAIDWTNLHYRDLYLLARYIPKFVETSYLPWLKGYQTLLLILLIAIIAGLVWSLLDRKRKDYTVLYYWLRTIIRYRASIYMMVWGFVKIFPVQCPYPSEGILNTTLGDMAIQKIYWWSVECTWYEIFGGVVEFTAGFLLFFRQTTAIGAALLVGVLATLTSANINYGGGVHIESTYFTICGLFLLLYYCKDIYNLLILQKYTVPNHYYPAFKQKWKKFTRFGIRTIIVVIFIVTMGYQSYLNFRYDPYNQAVTPSPVELRGVYKVKEFQANNKVIPYTAFDSVRWEDVTFENWTTMTFKVYQPVILELPKKAGYVGFGFNSGAPMRDIDRNLESFTGDVRRAYHYYLDSVNKLLYLEDKSINVKRQGVSVSDSIRKNTKLYSNNWISDADWANINDEYTKVNTKAHFTRRYNGYKKEYPVDTTRNRMILHYKVLDDKTVLLEGVNETNDSIRVLLERTNRKYILQENPLKAGSYD